MELKKIEGNGDKVKKRNRMKKIKRKRIKFMFGTKE